MRSAGSPRPSRARSILEVARTLRARIGVQGAARALGVLVALSLGLYALAPYQTVRSLRTALRAGESERVVDALDLERLRRSVRGQLSEYLAAEARTAPRPGTAQVVVGRMGPSVARAYADPLIDAIFTPEGVRRFLASDGQPAVDLVRMVRGPGSGDPPAAAPGPATTWLDPVSSQGFLSPLRFQVVLESGWELELRPRGLRWWIVDVALPSRSAESRTAESGAAQSGF